MSTKVRWGSKLTAEQVIAARRLYQDGYSFVGILEELQLPIGWRALRKAVRGETYKGVWEGVPKLRPTGRVLAWLRNGDMAPSMEIVRKNVKRCGRFPRNRMTDKELETYDAYLNASASMKDAFDALGLTEEILVRRTPRHDVPPRIAKQYAHKAKLSRGNRQHDAVDLRVSD